MWEAPHLCCLLGRFEAAAALLIHLGAGGTACISDDHSIGTWSVFCGCIGAIWVKILWSRGAENIGELCLKKQEEVCLVEELLTINGSKEELLRLHDLEQPLDVGENLDDHLLLSQLHVGVVAMCAVVDDTVHVQVEVVHHRHVSAGYRLVDERVPLAQPSVELGDPCSVPTRSVKIISSDGAIVQFMTWRLNLSA